MRVVSFVLYVIDDLTNRPVARGQVRAFSESEPLCRPVYKDGGWICFVNMPEGCHRITLDGKLYEKQCITVDTRENMKKENKSLSECPVITVRMQPGNNYPIPENCACIIGSAQPESLVWAVFKPHGNPIRLLEDYNGGRQIRLFFTEIKHPEGCSFAINEQGFFTIIGTIDGEAGLYMIDRELAEACKKGSTVIWPAARTQADVYGRFRFVFKCLGSSEYSVKMMNGKHCTKEFAVGAGEKIFADFKEE